MLLPSSLPRRIERRVSPLDRRDWPLGGRRATDKLHVCPSCRLPTDRAGQHDSERVCIIAIQEELGRLRRDQRTDAEREEECEHLRYSANTFADLAERLSERLRDHRAAHAEDRTPAESSDAHRHDRLAAVQVSLHRIVAELQQITAILRRE